jgi:hypothetical protein
MTFPTSACKPGAHVWRVGPKHFTMGTPEERRKFAQCTDCGRLLLRCDHDHRLVECLSPGEAVCLNDRLAAEHKEKLKKQTPQLVNDAQQALRQLKEAAEAGALSMNDAGKALTNLFGMAAITFVTPGGPPESNAIITNIGTRKRAVTAKRPKRAVSFDDE